jgi:hypothetical protein
MRDHWPTGYIDKAPGCPLRVSWAVPAHLVRLSAPPVRQRHLGVQAAIATSCCCFLARRGLTVEGVASDPKRSGGAVIAGVLALVAPSLGGRDVVHPGVSRPQSRHSR